jgi:mono/diheme cytochrome c family protein
MTTTMPRPNHHLLVLILLLTITPFLQANQLPQLTFPAEVTFPTAKMGEQVTVQAIGLNNTQQPIFIDSIKTSCGCTTATFDSNVSITSNVIIPITIDTNQKIGSIRKSIKVYTQVNPIPSTFFVVGFITENTKDHATMAKHHIFDQQCASCHVDQGKKQFGLGLYLADCAFCHGTNRQGASSMPLPYQAFQDTWLKVISDGRKNMSAFSEKHGGPLTDEQLASLEQFLKQPTTSPFKNLGNVHGAQIYRQACASCHGEMKLGPIGPDIRAHNIKHLSHQDLEKMLTEGKESSPMMPSFLREKGGFLTLEEIKKVVTFLKMSPYPKVKD